MSVPVWVAELAQAFWAAAGAPEPFPRELRRPLAWALPVSVVLLPQLHLDALRAWLRDNGIACPCNETGRPLRACLAARADHGLIFLDGADPHDEQRFSLAHELAHFLRHYWQPRRLARRHLGEPVGDVLDGKRLATPRERLHALLKQVPLPVELHLMRRGPGRQPVSADVARAEEEADRLAYELLAPAGEVLARTGPAAGDAGRQRLAAVLQTEFGLPLRQAEDYSGILLPDVWCDPVLRRLRS